MNEQQSTAQSLNKILNGFVLMNENSWFKKIKISFDLYCLKIKFSLLNKLWRAEKDSLVVQ